MYAKPGFEQLLGIELLETDSPSLAMGRMPVTERVRQPDGVVHGGAYAALAETVASAATMAVVREQGKVALGQSNHTTFLRPVWEGTVHASARRRHHGRSLWVWEVDLTDDEGRLCAVSRVTVAVTRLRSRPG
jgi:uncharacterized protein (TIGR00369 family)